MYNPFTGAPFGSQVKSLTGIAINGVNMNYSFNCQYPGTGEMYQIFFPYGGYLRFQTGAVNYSGNRMQREYYVWVHSKDGNGASSFQDTMTWNSFLGLTNTSGPNNVSTAMLTATLPGPRRRRCPRALRSISRIRRTKRLSRQSTAVRRRVGPRRHLTGSGARSR